MGGVLLCEKHGRDLNWKNVCEHIEHSDLLDMKSSRIKSFPNFRIILCESCQNKVDISTIEKYSKISFDDFLDFLEKEKNVYDKIESEINSKIKTKSVCSQCTEDFGAKGNN